MNILYISQIIDLNNRGIYPDLLSKLLEYNHSITVVRSDSNINSEFIFEEGEIDVLNVYIKNQFGINLIKKGLIYLQIENKFIKGIKKYLHNKSFDLIIYATPPVTFANVIEFCKQKYHAKTYLMLKDIFPQNAVDIGMLKTTGVKGIIYKYFRQKEKKMYSLSDKIGCMSQGNINYIIQNNPDINKNKLEVFPNAIIPRDFDFDNDLKLDIMREFQLATDKVNFIFGGNLGKPQALKMLIEFIDQLSNYNKAHFIIIGKGSEQNHVIEAAKRLDNLTYYPFLESDRYAQIVSISDVGIIFLDYRFTIPNYPSRILSYLENKKPILACTDKISDVQELVLNQAKCGLWNPSNDFSLFKENVIYLCEHEEERLQMGLNGRKYLDTNINIDNNVKLFENLVKENK